MRACCCLSAVVVLAGSVSLAAQQARPRARDLGITPGILEPGPLNAITDVEGVRVGHVTIVSGDRVRTGVTAIVPHAGNVFQEKVAGAVFVGNAFGKLAGSTQVRELGTIETPIVLTSTLSVGVAMEAVLDWTLHQPGNEEVRSVNALVGETNDGRLNDIRARSVTREHVEQAIRSAAGGRVIEGAVGAGTGTIAFGWKGGIGSSSRRAGQYTVGVLVQSNYGGVLAIDGVPVGKEMRPRPSAAAAEPSPSKPAAPSRAPGGLAASRPLASIAAEAGSCMIVVATDAPLTARDLERVAARAVFALARTGSSYSNGSGDYAIAFSTSPETRVRHGAAEPVRRTVLPTDAVSGLFEAVLEATEEAVYNSMLQAETMTGNGATVEALPVERLRGLLKQFGR